MRRLPEGVKQFIRENVKGISNQELADRVNEKFGTVYTRQAIASTKCRIGVKSGIDAKIKLGERRGIDTMFKRGHVPANKGKKFPGRVSCTSFKPGHVPHNHLLVGSELVKSDGYLYVKIAEPNKWKQKHRLVWEKAHGSVPRTHCIVFLDGDRLNCSLENLAIISRSVNARRNQNHLLSRDRELSKLGVVAAKLIEKLHRRKRGNKHG